MNFTIRDFAPIKEADIKLDGLTVIAGDNDTGKSTVGKLLYSVVAGARDYDRSHEDPSMAYSTEVYFQTKRLFEDNREHGTFGLHKDGETICYFRVLQHPEASGMAMDYNGTFAHVPTDFHNVLMFESPLVWQFFDTFQGIAAIIADAADRKREMPIGYPRTFFDVYRQLNGSNSISENSSELVRSIHDTIGGHVSCRKGENPAFVRKNKRLSMKSVATGIQAFALMQRMLELGLVKKGQLLILDEPEVHLHPKWQLEYAKLLVDMVDQLGLTVLLTTHSSVFVEAIDFVGRKKLGDRCSVYFSERDENDDVVMREVTDDLDTVYDALSEPLLRLSLLQEDA